MDIWTGFGSSVRYFGKPVYKTMPRKLTCRICNKTFSSNALARSGHERGIEHNDNLRRIAFQHYWWNLWRRYWNHHNDPHSPH